MVLKGDLPYQQVAVQYASKKKMMLAFSAFFQMCVYGTAAPQMECFFRRSGGLLVKTAGFVHTLISEMLCSFVYRIFTASFVFSGVSFVTAMVSVIFDACHSCQESDCHLMHVCLNSIGMSA